MNGSPAASIRRRPSMRRTMRWSMLMLTLSPAVLGARSTGEMYEDAKNLAFFRDVLLNSLYNPHVGVIDGKMWPPGSNALSMAGQRRLESFSALVATAVEDGVPGHVIETGVWRGGASFMVAKTLELMRERAASRRVYLADSFQGIPDKKTYRPAGSMAEAANQPAETKLRAAPTGILARIKAALHPPPPDPNWSLDDIVHRFGILNNNSASRVMADARRLGLDMSRLRFVVGYFNESLPALIRAEPDVQFAVVRLDGDTFFSTYEAIELLYPRLSDGGFLIVDDDLKRGPRWCRGGSVANLNGSAACACAMGGRTSTCCRGRCHRRSGRDGGASCASSCAPGSRRAEARPLATRHTGLGPPTDAFASRRLASPPSPRHGV